MFEHVKTFIDLAHKAEAIRDCDASWETKYDLIFSHTSSIRAAVLNTSIPFDWYDPNGSEEEDVRAYVQALLNKAYDLERLPEEIFE